MREQLKSKPSPHLGAGAARGEGAARGMARGAERKDEPPARPPERAASASVGTAAVRSIEASRAAAAGPASRTGSDCCSGSDCLLAETLTACLLETICRLGKRGSWTPEKLLCCVVMPPQELASGVLSMFGPLLVLCMRLTVPRRAGVAVRCRCWFLDMFSVIAKWRAVTEPGANASKAMESARPSRSASAAAFDVAAAGCKMAGKSRI